MKQGKVVPDGFKARFFTDRSTFVVCILQKVEKVVRNGKGKVKFVQLSNPVATGVSLVNEEAGDTFNWELGKHIAQQRAIAAFPKPLMWDATNPRFGYDFGYPSTTTITFDTKTFSPGK
jgi:hypothetical protein